MSKNGLYSNLFNTEVKQKNNESNGDDFLESDKDIMDMSLLDDTNINTEYATPSTSQPKNKQISLKVSTYLLLSMITDKLAASRYVLKFLVLIYFL